MNEPLLGLDILIQVGPPTPQSSRVHPKDGGPLRRKNFQKSPAPLVSRCWGSHRHLPSSGVTSSMADSPASISVRARLGISGKGHTTPEKVRRHEPWALSSARSHRKLPSRIRSLLAQAKLAGRGKVLPPRGHFLELQVPERCFRALQSLVCGAGKDTSAQACPGAGHRKRIQQKADRGEPNFERSI